MIKIKKIFNGLQLNHFIQPKNCDFLKGEYKRFFLKKCTFTTHTHTFSHVHMWTPSLEAITTCQQACPGLTGWPNTSSNRPYICIAVYITASSPRPLGRTALPRAARYFDGQVETLCVFQRHQNKGDIKAPITC